MEISQGALALLYWYALLLGVGLGALYDVLRITRIFLGMHYSRRAVSRIRRVRLPLIGQPKRRRMRRSLGVVVFFEDLFFSLSAGISVILLFYLVNQGRVRPPVILAVGAGFLLYRVTLGRLVMTASELIAFVIGTAVRYLIFFVLYPFRVLIKWCKIQSMRLCACAVMAYRKRRRRRFTRLEYQRVASDACGLIPTRLPTQEHIKRGKGIVKGNKKAVQSHPAGANSSRGTDRGVDRRIRKQRHEIQRASGSDRGA